MRLAVLALLGSALTLLADDNVVVARAAEDLNGDGRPDTVEIVMAAGQEYVDHEVWCNMSHGGLPKYRGRFVVRVRIAGRKPVLTELNPLLGKAAFDVEFNGRDWLLVLEDLNGDGLFEFSLGQYATCSGWEYTVLGIDARGRVKALSERIYSGDRANSSDSFYPTKRGFRFTTPYDVSTGSYSCTEFLWQPKTHVFVEGKTTPAPCPEAEDGDATTREESPK